MKVGGRGNEERGITGGGGVGAEGGVGGAGGRQYCPCITWDRGFRPLRRRGRRKRRRGGGEEWEEGTWGTCIHETHSAVCESLRR